MDESRPPAADNRPQTADPGRERRAQPVGGVEIAEYGRLPDGRTVQMYTLANRRGARVRLIEYGAITVGVEMPDREGRIADVTLGFDTLDEWLNNAHYFGATVGRYANRIAGACFVLDGRSHRLDANDGTGHLHGGSRGLHTVLWRSEPLRTEEAAGVRFSCISPDGDQGYPGALHVSATHWLEDDNAFRIEYVAGTDRTTVVNLTHHGCWNLAGPEHGDILRHELTIAADRYTPVNASRTPTGEKRAVAGTPLDFRRPAVIGSRLGDLPSGYDHNFVLRENRGKADPAATLYDPASGRVMELFTNQPGLQLYTGNSLDGSIAGKDGVHYSRHRGLCLESQRFPDAPNQPHFPSAILRPGETYRHEIIHRFSVR